MLYKLLTSRILNLQLPQRFLDGKPRRPCLMLVLPFNHGNGKFPRELQRETLCTTFSHLPTMVALRILRATQLAPSRRQRAPGSPVGSQSRPAEHPSKQSKERIPTIPKGVAFIKTLPETRASNHHPMEPVQPEDQLRHPCQAPKRARAIPR